MTKRSLRVKIESGKPERWEVFAVQDGLDTPIQYLKGVGPKRAQLYQKLGIGTVRQLLWHFPRSYINFGDCVDIAAAELDQVCSVRARIVSKSGEQRIRKGLSVFKVKVADDTGDMTLIFYNTKYTVDALELFGEYVFYGRVSGNFLHREMNSPQVFTAEQAEKGGLYPVYPLTAGITSKVISANVEQALSLFGESLTDFLPAWIRQEHQLCQLEFALRQIHRPKDIASAEIAKRRLIFDEFLMLSLALGSIRSENRAASGYQMDAGRGEMETFYRSLPFVPTGAQKRAIEDGVRDMCGTVPMNRLVQGDVGSGKTLVAAACCWFAYRNGYQSALMAPTEILAMQHRQTLQRQLEPLGMRVEVLTSSMPAPEKRRIRQALAAGEIDLLVGTHALISDGVTFRNLALVVTDEQHRFGVAQRVKLAQKGENPHLLVMSATPIPRTLALMIYGDLDLSVIDELPPGRSPVLTYRVGSDKRERAYGFVRRHLDEGRQGYVVCPLIEQGEIDSGLKPAVELMQELAEGPFAGYRVGLLHGKMKQAEKDRVMSEFKDGKLQLLVSTTVVEVGVDVPNAVIMMIENAERFGLSQLHQLRGRVGRGSHQSYCILLSDARNQESRQRLGMMCKTTNGFEIAEFDLKLRGPGDFLGYRQHGLPQLAIADMAKDVGLLQSAQQAGAAILQADPRLELPEHQRLREQVEAVMQNVGGQVN